MIDTVFLTPRDLDLSVSLAEVEQAASLLASARERLQRYPEFREDLTPSLDLLVYGADVLLKSMNETGP